MNWRKLALLALSTLVLAGCGKTTEFVGEDDSIFEDEVEEEEEPVVMELPNFTTGEKLAKYVDSVYTGENCVVSPLSMDYALGMLNEGGVVESLASYIGYMDENSVAKYKDIDEVHVANSVWLSDQYDFLDGYSIRVKSKYDAESSVVDFTDDATLERVNEWISDNTNNQIKNLITRFDDDAAVVLVNALHFKDAWTDTMQMDEGTFNNADGTQSNVTMLLSDEGTGYISTPDAVGFSKSYMNGDLTFFGVVPNEPGDFELSDLDFDLIIGGRSYDYLTRVTMPKFRVEGKMNMVDTMNKIGLGDVLANKRWDTMVGIPLEISDIIQGCMIEVDENGTEAAAATEIGMVRMSVMEPEKEIREVVLDRPFAFFIYNEVTHEVLFAGKVVSL